MCTVACMNCHRKAVAAVNLFVYGDACVASPGCVCINEGRILSDSLMKAVTALGPQNFAFVTNHPLPALVRER